MASFLDGSTNPTAPRRFAIAVSRFNAPITEALLEGATRTFVDHGIPADAVDVARGPGAFELPLVCDKLAATGKYNAVVALGCVVRGDTPHFDYVCGECGRGLMDVGLKHQLPIIFGVLTTDTMQQALHRADASSLNSSDGAADGDTEKHTPKCNKGAEAALCALEMTALLPAIS